MKAVLAGWKIRGRRAHKAQPGSELVFSATPVRGVRLEIVGHDGQEARNATATFKSGLMSYRFAWRAQAPRLEVPPGTYTLVVTAGNNDEFRSKSTPLTVPPDDDVQLRVTLAEAPVLFVSLKFPEYEASPGTVYVMPRPDGSAPGARTLHARGQSSHVNVDSLSPVATRSLTSRFDNLTPGPHAVGFTRQSDGPFDTIQVVDVVQGRNDITLKIPKLDPSRYVVVRLRAPADIPIGTVELAAGHRDEDGEQRLSTVHNAVRRPNHEYYVLRAPGAPTTGTHFVKAKVLGLGERSVSFTPDDRGPHEIRFGAPATIEVVVGGIEQASVPEPLLVFVVPAEPVPERTVMLHRLLCHAPIEGGRATLQGVQPGRYRIGVAIADPVRVKLVHDEAIDVASGTNTARLALPPVYAVTVQGASGLVLLLRLGEPPIRRTARASDGEAHFHALPPGRYLAASGGKRAQFEVPGVRTVVLEAK